MKKLVTIIVLVAAVQLVLVSATYAAPPAWGGNGSGNCSGQYHCVQWGETLHSIGRTYNANPRCLAQANGLWDPNVIYAGQVLYIPASCPPYPWDAMYPPNPCQYDCGYNPRPEQPIYHPKPYPQPNPCNSGCYDQGCNSGCYNQGYYGYDYTGYYYGNGNDRYSHTCGYYNNCW